MQKRPSLFFRAAGFYPVTLGLFVLLAACTSTTGRSTSPPAAEPAVASPRASSGVTPVSATPAPSATGQSVSITNFAFNPAMLNVAVGTQVTWTNNGSVAHTVTADQGAFDGKVAPGESFAFTFAKPGTFAYHCSIHPSMKATVTVK